MNKIVSSSTLTATNQIVQSGVVASRLFKSTRFLRQAAASSTTSSDLPVFTKGVLLVGRPGAGKGTYASRAAEKLGIPHIAAGDIIREEIKAGSEFGKKVKEYTSKGELVPDELVMELLVDRISKIRQANAGRGFFLDGFPRTLNQAVALDAISDKIKLDLVINLHQDEDIIIAKTVNRRICSKCGTGYNYAHIKRDGLDMPPLVPKVEGVCDTCGAKDSLIQRDDDKEEVIVKRLAEYEKLTSPLLSFYEKKGLLKNFIVNGGAKALLPSFLKLLQD
ncbi:adenylate kinase domain-containing protein [Naegleria gruberi]|uniref:Adenylate kinase domain-containing protein n=1 Tax=Naegleria gruberi TaxID=5762 RepID=D2VJP7_NAEGR|nr:adenylate kinase domain-containing protein [Naegleria gruberi]EFC42990.1 adenylate kinase domain-containing protein [Naegleria gruberi]|eukprot:XP_002675734.1 adenylate kinase domain-containing protein [Naegleria gruberi strain NEG-M]